MITHPFTGFLETSLEFSKETFSAKKQ